MKRSLVLVLCVVLTSLLSPGCGENEEKKVVDAWSLKVEGDVYVAALLPYTGVWAVGTGLERGVVLALKEINDAGGVNGKKLGLLVANSDGDKTKGIAAMNDLAKRGDVGAVIGPARSVVTVGSGAAGDTGAAKVAIESKILMVSPAATSPLISTLADDGYVFRTTVSDAVQGMILAKMAERQGFSRVFIAQAARDAYTLGIREKFVTAFAAAKGNDAVAYYEFDTEQSDFSMSVLNAAKVKWAPAVPDAILLAAFTADGAAVVNASATFDWGSGPAPKWLMPDSMKEDKLLQSLSRGDLLNEANVFGTNPASPTGSEYATFASAYRAMFGEEPAVYSANAYDAAYLVAGAMVLAADPTKGEELKNTILKLSPVAGGPVAAKFAPGQWSQMVEELKKSGAVDYEGASGDVDFDPNGDVFSNIAEWTVKAGKLEWGANNCWTAAGVPCE